MKYIIRLLVVGIRFSEPLVVRHQRIMKRESFENAGVALATFPKRQFCSNGAVMR